jgi:hypothetical protein
MRSDELKVCRKDRMASYPCYSDDIVFERLPQCLQDRAGKLREPARRSTPRSLSVRQ